MRKRGALASIIVVVSIVALTALVVWPAVGAAQPAELSGCTITGTPGNDVLVGTEGDDVICGLGGNDVIDGKGGDDVLLGGPGADTLRGGPGDDVLIGGPGENKLLGGAGLNSLRTEPIKNDRSFDVHAISTYNVPDGTKITWTYLDGNCTKNESTGTFTHKLGEVDHFSGSYIAKADGWCAFEKSNARYRVRFQTPGGLDKDVVVDLAQGSSPNIYVRSFHFDCQGGNIGCNGGSDTSVSGLESVKVPISFGPLKDPDPLPPPEQDPDLFCGGTFHVKVDQPIVNLHVCTSEGYPLPKLEYEGTVPASVKGSRWPSDKDTWIVMNGTFPKTGRYYFQVRATLPSRHFEALTSAAVEVEPR
jgi:hypothetical protein